MTAFVTRFAPSPTGLLHIGHAYSVQCVYRAAQQAGGRFILRIEDIDRERCKAEFEEAIFEDLKWLGLAWETPVRRQSDHFDDYQNALQKLIDLGLVYRCFKTRKEIANDIERAPHLTPTGPEGVPFFGEAMGAEEENALMAKGLPFAWRLSLERAQHFLGARFDDLSFVQENIDAPSNTTTIKAKPEMFGDVILGRKDSGTSYHLASVHDDALQGVTHIIRGDDLSSAAHLHVLLQALLGLPTPTYRHHKLLIGPDGKKFSKRDHSVTLQSLREQGTTPDSLF